MQEISLAPLAREDLGRLIADTLQLRAGARRPAGATGAREDERQSVFRHPVHFRACRRGAARASIMTPRAGAGISIAFTPRGTPTMWSISWSGSLTRLPVATQAALQQLACLGNVAKITMLSVVLGKSEEDIRSDLWDAVRLELVEHLEGSYKFIHDRVQEAAYSLIPEPLRAEAHLRIGRLLAAHTPAEKREEDIFEIVNQLNRGAALITSRDEREQFAELNLIAGRRAKATTAYASALTYLTAGEALLPEELVEAPARAHLCAGAAPGRMRVPHRRAGGGGAAPGGAVKPRRKYGGTSYRRVLARRSVHRPRSERPRHCRRARLPPASGHRLVAASDARGSTTRIRADLVAAREPHDRGLDRAAFDERPGIPRDAWMF